MLKDFKPEKLQSDRESNIKYYDKDKSSMYNNTGIVDIPEQKSNNEYFKIMFGPYLEESKQENKEIVELLIKSGANVDKINIINSLKDFELFKLCLENYKATNIEFTMLVLAILYFTNYKLKLSDKIYDHIKQIIFKESIKRGVNIFKDFISCDICEKNYLEDPNNECVVFFCGHNFHKKCLPLDYECPICKSKLNINKYFPNLNFPEYIKCKEYKDLVKNKNKIFKIFPTFGWYDGRSKSKSKRSKSKSKRRKTKSKRIKTKSKRRK